MAAAKAKAEASRTGASLPLWRWPPGPARSPDQSLSQPKQTHRQSECGHPPVKGEAARAMSQHMGQPPAAKPM